MHKVRRKYFYRIGGLFLLLLLGYFYVFKNEDEQIKDQIIATIERSIRSPSNQGECRIPLLPVYQPEIMKFYNKTLQLNCGNSLNDWVMCEKSICFIKPEISSSHGEVICSYTDLIRKTDYKVKYGTTKKTKDIYILEKSDFVKVACTAKNGESWRGIVYGIRDSVDYPDPNQQFPQLINNAPIPPNNIENAQSSTYFNVLVFGFDSMSQNAVIRKLPKTYAYLTTNLGAIVLQGYNIVGDGTPAALIPLLTGFTELELPETRKRMPNANYVDVYPMIWKKFKELGYVTSFNEDAPSIGTFTYRMKGFQEQPVDHYLRTFYIESENTWESGLEHCIGHQPNHVVMLDYTQNFMLKYKEAPTFVFSFHASLSHDSTNDIGAADEDVLDWLHTLKNKQLLDNTILVFMSDHGNRFSDVRATLQGKQEERLPFFSFTFPESFKNRFPTQFANFKNNANRLTTPFDVHATLKHLLKLQQEESSHDAYFDAVDEEVQVATSEILITKMAKKRAISLFDSVPKQRSCADAYIEPHWCSCLNWEPIALDDVNFLRLSEKLVASILSVINNATKDYRPMCADLKSEKINWAMKQMPKKEMLHFKGNSDVDGYLGDMTGQTRVPNEIYQLQIVVNPGESLFEASVTYDVRTSHAATKLSDISRINKYGKQANCIYEVNPELRKYCYCTV